MCLANAVSQNIRIWPSANSWSISRLLPQLLRDPFPSMVTPVGQISRKQTNYTVWIAPIRVGTSSGIWSTRCFGLLGCFAGWRVGLLATLFLPVHSLVHQHEFTSRDSCTKILDGGKCACWYRWVTCLRLGLFVTNGLECVSLSKAKKPRSLTWFKLEATALAYEL